jgi:GNAT superfamily N-acetyltransferase
VVEPGLYELHLIPEMNRGLDVDGILPRRLTIDDAPGGHRLSTQAGWNQTVHDWRLMLGMGQGIGFVDPEESLIGTAVLVPYRTDIDWVSMVLVDEQWRRRGLGRRLTQLVVELSPRPILGLDATDFGLGIYRDLGFGAAEQITRFTRNAGETDVSWGESTQISVPSEDSFRECLNAFIRDSEPVRVDLLSELDPERTGRLCMIRGDRAAAIALIRQGRESTQIGPLMATDAGSATTLLRWVVAHQQSKLIIDVFDENQAFARQLPEMGFEAVRQFRRMFRGGRPRRQSTEYAVTGPEFG